MTRKRQKSGKPRVRWKHDMSGHGALLTEVLVAELEVDELVARARFPIEDTVVHSDEEGAACAGGVAGSPWWNVEVPYTPMGCDHRNHVGIERQDWTGARTSPVSPWHLSNVPAS